MLKTLSLNSSGVPVSVIRAVPNGVIAVLNKRATVIANYDKEIKSSDFVSGYDFVFKKTERSSIVIPIPSVIQFVHSHFTPKFTKTLPFNRMNVYIRDRGMCMYCGKKVALNSFTFDHIVPRCEKGESCWENVVISCVKCNNEKDRMSLKKFKKKLIRKPYAPRLDKAAPSHLVSKIAAEIPHETWTDYIYWRIELER